MRKQDYQLTLKDISRFSAWEYALDEEEVEGQNERTVRPYLVSPPLDPERAYFIVRANFYLANGTQKLGFITPRTDSKGKMMRPLIPYDLNPVIVTDDIQIVFCYGVNKPNKSTLQKNYDLLGYSPGDVFPIKFQADVGIHNGIQEGILEGFLYFNSSQIDFFNVSESDIRSIK